MEKMIPFDKIKNWILGTERCREEEGLLTMCRFTEKEQEVYLSNPPFHRKTFSSSNMVISFLTDAEGLTLEYDAQSASSCFFADLDVKVNGILLAHASIKDVREAPLYTLSLPLPGKESKVEIFLPPLAQIRIKSLSLENASFAKAAPRDKLVISYGDSITHGYHSTYPAISYTSIFGESLKAEVINKGIGGDIFNPPLAKAGSKGRTPHAVTIAYGTNDWSSCPLETIQSNCSNFLSALRELYPASPLIMILPIWRANHDKETPSGNFFAVREEMRRIGEKIKDLYIIDGLLLTPHVPGFYSDGLHPNDQGFILMGENLIKETRKLLPALWQ